MDGMDSNAAFGGDGWSKHRAPFASPDNLESAAVYLQSSLKSFGFSGRVNFLSSAPEDVANTFNCVHYLLQRIQKAYEKSETATTEAKRLRNELGIAEQTQTRLKKELELRERDIGSMMIKERQMQAAHAEELRLITRDRDDLQKKCQDLTRRQYQFQHEIRRKELEYERLQDKLRYYLAEKKREAKTSMEIVGKLRQQSQQGKINLSGKLDDDIFKSATRGGGKFRPGVKLDENLVKMIVRAYEDKQKDLLMENKDLKAALQSLQREYTTLLNASMDMPDMPHHHHHHHHHHPGNVVPFTRVDGTRRPSSPRNLDTLAAPTSSVTPRGTHSESLARTPSINARQPAQEPAVKSTHSPVASPPHSQADELDDAGTVVSDFVDPEGSSDAGKTADGRKLDTGADPSVGTPSASTAREWEGVQLAENSTEHPTEPPVEENSVNGETVAHVGKTGQGAEDPKDPKQTEGTDDRTEVVEEVVLASQGAGEADQQGGGLDEAGNSGEPAQEPETEEVVTEGGEAGASDDVSERRGDKSPGRKSFDKTLQKFSSLERLDQLEGSPRMNTSPFAVSGDNTPTLAGGKSGKFVWPPPSASPTTPTREGRSPPQRGCGLGKLPMPSKNPVPNAANLTDDQLKAELRIRAQEVEEAVRALRAACTTMRPQDMRSVLEKRLHMELVMAANLAEQQEAVVNLALVGLEKALHNRGTGDLDDRAESEASLASAIGQLEAIGQKFAELLVDAPEDLVKNLQEDFDGKLEDVRAEMEELREELELAKKKVRDLQRSGNSMSELLEKNMTTLRQRTSNLTKEADLLKSAKQGLSGDLNSEPKKESRRQTWAEKAEREQDEQDAADLERVITLSDVDLKEIKTGEAGGC